MATVRNKPWSRDQLILALDLYLQLPHEQFIKDAAEVMELSERLRKFPLEAGEWRSARYRSASSIVMKLWNFASIDPNFHGAGLPACGKQDREVWDELSIRRERLSQLAVQINETVDALDTSACELPQIPDGVEEATEGRILTRVHLARERDRRLVHSKKQRALHAQGVLACEACSFDFQRIYGNRGRGVIECHHNIPLHLLRPDHRTRLDDLSLLCSNCHRIIHSRRPWLSVDELKALLPHQ